MSLPSLRPDLAFDPTPLTEPVDNRKVREHHDTLKAARTRTAGDVFVSVIIPFVVLIGLIPLVLLFRDLARLPAGPVVVISVLAVIAAGATLITIRVRRRIRRDWEIRYRLDHFATANHMTYEHQVRNPKLPGMIFSVGGDRIATDVIRTQSQPTVEYGHHQYLVSRGKSSTHFRWGYIAIELDTTLPHIVLDAVTNNSALGTNLPASFSGSQRLSLEGDFDRHFALYCPSGYERDALYLFSPDIMARFVDRAALFDIEIVDNTLFLYTGPGISTTSPEQWAWLFDTVHALQAKVDQWSRWRDDRLEQPAITPTDASVRPSVTPPVRPPGVGVDGRRLRRGAHTATLWGIVIAVAVGLLAFGIESL
ncbi:hypothetical protein L1277_001089 [Okibacterium sp. HSC-33S16]|uniref:hypothetical protein n=1 Tax=Okibacterium sp. HSC-33S16 TaxID=2910965 RepID=UPI00209D8023|nr:hypothetical protein [Okibacterium sp. HSC-33S16]MCP2030998.1 hypothetical protein [Okibacterium sp. HSC-33S16]